MAGELGEIMSTPSSQKQKHVFLDVAILYTLDGTSQDKTFIYIL